MEMEQENVIPQHDQTTVL